MKKKLLFLMVAIFGLAFLWKFTETEEAPIALNSSPDPQKPSQKIALQPINLQEKVDDQSNRPGVQSRDFSASVAGIDANNDGVRDDIEEFIIKKYSDPRQRAAMMQVARTSIPLLTVNHDNKDEVAEVVKINFRALACARQHFGSKDSPNLSKEIFAMILNTETRWRAYSKFRSVGGYEVPGPRRGEIVCDDELKGEKK